MSKPSPLHQRLLTVVGSLTHRAVAVRTGQNAETVRRYLRGQAPSVEFVAAVCEAFGICADWLLTGRGPMREAEIREHALAQANPGELLSAIAENLERIAERVDRLERYVHTLETRVRSRTPAVEVASGVKKGLERDGETEAVGPRLRRAEFVADAIVQRPRQNTG